MIQRKMMAEITPLVPGCGVGPGTFRYRAWTLQTVMTGIGLALFSAACTPYGQHHSAGVVREQLGVVIEQTQKSYVRSQATLLRLEALSREDDGIADLVQRYREVITRHADFVNEWQHRPAVPDDQQDYRSLSYQLRAAVTGRDLIQSGYTQIGTELMVRRAGYRVANPGASDAESIITPPYFRALQSGMDRFTVAEGIRAISR